MSHAYQDTSEEVAKSYKRIHGNGEETHVHIISCGERYIVLVGDVDPRVFEGVDGNVIAYSPTFDAAQERAVAWMENHPKGLLDDGEDEGESFGSKVWSYLQKLDMSDKQNQQGENA